VLEAPFVDEDDEEDAEDLLPVEDEVPLDCLLGTSGVVGEADLELDDDDDDEEEWVLLVLFGRGRGRGRLLAEIHNSN